MKPFLFAILGSVILGGLSFAAGFFGPIYFTPEANQGPLLGIFITGPLGLLVGFILGGLYGNRARTLERKTAQPAADQK